VGKKANFFFSLFFIIFFLLGGGGGGGGVTFIINSCLYCNVYNLSTEKWKDEGTKITAFWYVSTSRMKRIMTWRNPMLLSSVLKDISEGEGVEMKS